MPLVMPVVMLTLQKVLASKRSGCVKVTTVLGPWGPAPRLLVPVIVWYPFW